MISHNLSAIPNWQNSDPSVKPTGRLASLDILRGLDLFLLVFLQPVLVAVCTISGLPVFSPLLYQLDHEVWVGFRAWDLVMPLFLFMVGASMPFSFAKYCVGKADRHIYRKIIRRFLLLFLFGMIVQGNLLAFDLSRITIYTNTLQAIAVGYLIAAMIILHVPVQWQPWLTLVLLLLYWIPMALCGDYSPDGSFAYEVDRIILGRFRGDLTYTWVWSSLTFGATVMLGTFAGRIMKDVGPRKTRAAFRLTVIGVMLVVVGLLSGLVIPIIKRLWTSSMTLYSGGLCFLLMALFYYIVDCRGFTRGLGWLRIYGMNPITAYILGEVIDFRSIVRSVSFGLEPYLGAYYDVWLTFGNYAILFLILYLMYRHRIFLKI